MALKKKNVFQEFMQDDYVPSGEQRIVKYLFGKGNNLHQVESPGGSIFLVTMPKKFRQTVWLKKGDCLVIDPITEGKKVLGEIICVVPPKSVVKLISTKEWIPKIEELDANVKEETSKVTGAGGDATEDTTTTTKMSTSTEEQRIAAFIEFYNSSCKPSPETESCMPPSDSESEESSSDSNSSL